MNSQSFKSFKPFFLIPFLLLLTSCAAGDSQFSPDNQAGFWYGLWHGIISCVSLIIHIFNDAVTVYETNNSGGWYDSGFLVGVICIWGGGSHMSRKSAADKKRDKEWEVIGNKVEIKVMSRLKNWADNENIDGDEDWDEICDKVETKLKRKIREWAEKE